MGEDSLYQCLSRVLAHFLNLLTTPSGAHSPGIAVIVLLLFELDIGAVARYYDCAARLPASKTGSWLQSGIALREIVLGDGRARRRDGHVVWVG
jgi:hypothetical protein